MKRTALLFIVLVAFLGSNGGGAYAQIDSLAFADPTLEALWNRSDAAVAAQRTTASWLWGPGPLTGGLREPYAESAGGTRLVQYFDKARDENILASQSQLLRHWRITCRQIGNEVGSAGMQDNEIIRMLIKLRRPTFFTRDLGFYDQLLSHQHYCLVCLAVE